MNIAQLLNYIDRLKKLPWAVYLKVTSGGFVVATICTTSAIMVLSPKSEQLLGPRRKAAPVAKFSPKVLSHADVKGILQRNLFNKEGKVPDEETDKIEKIKKPIGPEAMKTDLPIKLIGTIFGGDPYSGIALIEDKKSRSIKTYWVGHSRPLINNVQAKIIEIHREKIIIDRVDHREYLMVDLPEKKVRGRAKKKAPSKAPKRASYATRDIPDAFKEPGFERKGQNIVISDDYKKKLITKDLTKVLQDAKAEPFYEAGELGGFRLTRIRQDSIYEKAGLQNLDVIKEINGVPLKDAAQAIMLLNSLKGEKEIEVRLERGGSAVNVNVQVQ